MSGYTLAACTHLSSVFPSSGHVPTHVVPTERRDLPLATALTDILDDHASHSSLFTSPESDDVLIRIVQGTLAVELVSLSHNVLPVRFVFPALVVPNPALVTFAGNLFLVVVTVSGSLYKIHVPIARDGQFWHEPFSKNWCREWQIRKLGGQEPRLVHAHSPHDVAIALSSEGFLRLESHSTGPSDHDGMQRFTPCILSLTDSKCQKCGRRQNGSRLRGIPRCSQQFQAATNGRGRYYQWFRHISRQTFRTFSPFRVILSYDDGEAQEAVEQKYRFDQVTLMKRCFYNFWIPGRRSYSRFSLFSIKMGTASPSFISLFSCLRLLPLYPVALSIYITLTNVNGNASFLLMPRRPAHTVGCKISP